MTETNQMILKGIKEGKSIKELSNEFNLTYKQLYHRINQIESKGYAIKRNYNANGTLSYNLYGDGCYRDNIFYLKNTHKKTKMAVISDLHIGGIKSDVCFLNTIYEYCIKNDIHVIVLCGDLLDGTFSRREIIIDPEEQIDYIIKNYPFDESIINILAPGDHDISLLNKTKMSLHDVINKKRHDIANISTEFSDKQNNILMLNSNKIVISHKASYFETNNINDVKLHLCGHMHTSRELYCFNKRQITPRIFVPALCRNSFDGEINFPRAIELDIYLNQLMEFEVVQKKDLMLLNDRVIKTGETFINYSDKDIDIYRYNGSKTKKQKQH